MIINIQDDILKLNNMGLLEALLIDKTTKSNIMWATDAYEDMGEEYYKSEGITISAITGANSDIVKTRARKEMEHRQNRTKTHGEVFTPLCICNMMNNHADQALGEKGNTYWKKYIDRKILETACGEAPFLTTRYDMETGEMIKPEDRKGLLDRKLKIVNENADNKQEWEFWVKRSFQSIYGYEYQGDNLLIARVNLLMAYEEYYMEKWREKPALRDYQKIANIIAWNLWQMDGLTGTIPYYDIDEDYKQISILEVLMPPKDGEEKNKKAVKPPCKIYNWRRDNSIVFKGMRQGERKMKFDFVIGNPPYQEEQDGDNKTYAPPVYHKFLDQAYTVADKVELIHPARFLFNAGSTPRQWNKKMLNDVHLKVLWYEQNSGKVFSNTDIKGGIAVTYRDAQSDFGAIGTFTAFEELNSIMRKVRGKESFESISDIVVTAYAYHFTEKLHEEHPEVIGMLSKGHANDLKTNTFDRIPHIFFDKNPKDGHHYIQILGRVNNQRVYKFIREDYVNEVENLKKWKVFVPAANGSGALGEVLATPLIGRPLIGHTESFISIGACKAQNEAEAVLKYVKTKFARCLLGILKITQHNPPEKWSYIPLQNFTMDSDIDWSVAIAEIDKQLYKKYELDDKEIAFVETRVKEMEE